MPPAALSSERQEGWKFDSLIVKVLLVEISIGISINILNHIHVSSFLWTYSLTQFFCLAFANIHFCLIIFFSFIFAFLEFPFGCFAFGIWTCLGSFSFWPCLDTDLRGREAAGSAGGGRMGASWPRACTCSPPAGSLGPSAGPWLWHVARGQTRRDLERGQWDSGAWRSIRQNQPISM